MNPCLPWRGRVVILCTLIGLTLSGLPAALQAAERPVLRLYNWEQYMDPELAAEFGRRHKARVEETHFESDTMRDRYLADTKGQGFDLVIVDEGQVPIYRDRGWLAPIGESRVPGLTQMGAKWRGGSADATATHAFPYAWGTVGIGYRADLVREVPDSWLDLFRPDAATCGRVQVFANARELVGAALKAGGDSANSTDPLAYQRAERLLRAQKPCVASYLTAMSEPDLPLVTGSVSAAMIYGVDSVNLRKFNPNIRFAMPREGGLVFTDYLVVLASSTRKELAYAFLQFLSEPANAARLSSAISAATPNVAGQALLPAEIRNDSAIYPSDADLKAAEQIQRPSPAIVSMVNHIFAKIVRQD
ncbi:MAG: spermidine/putrescine ABC transporter substrate-binding protein [Gammaproteobacteria bacterium]|nr:spermidine/putrescine ABC transporter substrate-binding protein [Gammaproteobacteria bacterium]